jgi:hypothetical protein
MAVNIEWKILGKMLNREMGLLFLDLGQQKYVPRRTEVARSLPAKCMTTTEGKYEKKSLFMP